MGHLVNVKFRSVWSCLPLQILPLLGSTTWRKTLYYQVVPQDHSRGAWILDTLLRDHLTQRNHFQPARGWQINKSERTAPQSYTLDLFGNVAFPVFASQSAFGHNILNRVSLLTTFWRPCYSSDCFIMLSKFVSEAKLISNLYTTLACDTVDIISH